MRDDVPGIEPEQPEELLLAEREQLPAEAAEPGQPQRRFTVRGVAIAGARVMAGLTTLGVAVAAVTGTSLLPLPTLSAQPSSLLVTPVPTAQQLVCPGGMLRLADDSGQGANTASPLGSPRVTADAASLRQRVLAESDAGTGGTSAAPTVLSVPPAASGATDPALISGAQAQRVDVGDFTGLAAADCRGGSGELWLVGGSTAIGRTTLLTIANASEVAAVVDLELWGERGPVSAAGTLGIPVAAGGQRVLSLAGFQPGLVSPVLRLSSSGGQITASLQQSVQRVLDPGGLDLIASATGPATTVVIPGLRITDEEAIGTLLSNGPDYLDTRTVLRLLAPGQGQVPVTVRLLPEQSPEQEADAGHEAEQLQLTLSAGRVMEVPLEELHAGSYTVVVESALPLVAGVRVTTATAPGADQLSDFAWLAAAPALTGTTQLSIAQGPAPLLHLANPGFEAISAELDGPEGAQLLQLAAGASLSVPVLAGESYLLRGVPVVHAAVTVATGDGIAGYPVHPPAPGVAPIRVY